MMSMINDYFRYNRESLENVLIKIIKMIIARLKIHLYLMHCLIKVHVLKRQARYYHRQISIKHHSRDLLAAR